MPIFAKSKTSRIDFQKLGHGCFFLTPYPGKLIYLNFKSLEVVSRYRDPQPQVAENYSYLFNLSTNISKS